MLCLVTQLDPTLWDPVGCSLPGSVHGIFQARILEWNIPSPGIFLTQGSSQGLLHCRWILYQMSYQGSPTKWYIQMQTSGVPWQQSCSISYETTSPYHHPPCIFPLYPQAIHRVILKWLAEIQIYYFCFMCLLLQGANKAQGWEERWGRRKELLVIGSLSYYLSLMRTWIWAWHELSSVQFSSVTQSCPTLCDPMNHSTPGFPVHHQLPEFTQTHVHWVSDAIQPSLPQSSPSPPAPNPSQHQGLFQWVNSSHEVAKVLEFQLQHQSFQWTPRTNL